jgi:hypothetical protein
MTGLSPKGRGALEVIVFEDTRFRGSQMFTASEVTVGNDPGVMLQLGDASLSACHAVFRFDGETCVVANYDEGQGTCVNGLQVAEQVVSPSDEITVGRFKLRITIHKADATPAPVSVRPPNRAPVAARPPAPAPVPASPPSMVAAAAPPTIAKPPATPPVPRPPLPSPVPAPSPTRSAPVPSPVPLAKPVSRPVPSPVPPSKPVPSPRPATATAMPMAKPVAPAPMKPPVAAPVAAPVKAPPPAAKEAVPISEIFEVTTERNAMRFSSSEIPLPGFEDDEDAPFEPTFSLYDNLRDSGLSAASATKDHAVEVVRFRRGCVVKLHHLRRGEKLRLPGLRKPLGRSPSRGAFLFHGDALPENAAILEGGQPIEDAAWRARADKRGRILLDTHTQVVFPLRSGEGLLVHLVPAATPLPKPPLRIRLTKMGLALAGASVLVHLIVFAIVSIGSLVRRDFIADNKDGRFARIALKEIELEPPPPPAAKKEKKKEKPKTETSTAAPTETTTKVTTRIPKSRPTTPQTQASATAQKLLSALGGGPGNGPKISAATAMSNLDAVGPVKGQGGFKVSGAIGKLPGDSLRLASAGSGIGRIDTKGGNDVGKNLGKLLGKGPSGQVRAQVTAKPTAMKVEGHLDRGEIQKVINAHIHELQGCFERQLIMSPNLSGKVSFEWVIGTSGAVTTVRIKSSSLSSNEATSCMQAAIRRWQFPSPRGGQVTVVYPIALSSSGT